VAVKFVVTPASVDSKSSGGWFQVLEQHRVKHTGHSASAYLCVRQNTNDTVWLLSPGTWPKCKKDREVWAFYNFEVRAGDTVVSKIKSESYAAYLKFEKVIGRPGVPIN
jgi:hypothetical protein